MGQLVPATPAPPHQHPRRLPQQDRDHRPIRTSLQHPPQCKHTPFTKPGTIQKTVRTMVARTSSVARQNSLRGVLRNVKDLVDTYPLGCPRVHPEMTRPSAPPPCTPNPSIPGEKTSSNSGESSTLLSLHASRTILRMNYIVSGPSSITPRPQAFTDEQFSQRGR